jgi:hypothetical protein
MDPSSSSNPRPRWRKTETNSGFATFISVQSLNEARPRCLPGRGLQGFPVVTAERCDGTSRQQWRLGASGDLLAPERPGRRPQQRRQLHWRGHAVLRESGQ